MSKAWVLHTEAGVGLVLMVLAQPLPAAASHNPIPSCVTSWGSQGGADGQFFVPRDIAVHRSTGTVYVSDPGNSRIQKFSSTGEFLAKWNPGFGVTGIDVDPAGLVYVAITGKVARFTSDGVAAGSYNLPVLHSFISTDDVAVCPSGNVLVAAADSVFRFTSAGAFLGVWPADVGGFASIACDANEDVLLTGDDEKVHRFSAAGTPLCTWNTTLVGPGGIAGRYGIGIDWTGRILVAVTDGIQVYETCGTHYASWGGFGSACGQFMDAAGVALDNSGRIYIVDLQVANVEVFDYTVPTRRSSWGTLKVRYR